MTSTASLAAIMAEPSDVWWAQVGRRAPSLVPDSAAPGERIVRCVAVAVGNTTPSEGCPNCHDAAGGFPG